MLAQQLRTRPAGRAPPYPFGIAGAHDRCYGKEPRMATERRHERAGAGPAGAEEEGPSSRPERSGKGPTPPANRVATEQHEAEGEGYRRRGRRALTGESVPLKDMADEAPAGHAGEE
jgi:hypothetical protein